MLPAAREAVERPRISKKERREERKAMHQDAKREAERERNKKRQLEGWEKHLREREARLEEREAILAHADKLEARRLWLRSAWSELERHKGMAIEVERASLSVLNAYRSLRLEDSLQRMRASVSEPVSPSLRAVDWDVPLERREAIKMAREQEHAVRQAIEEVARVHSEMNLRMGQMQRVAVSLSESAKCLVDCVNPDKAENRIQRMRRAWNLHPHANWGTGWDSD